MTAAPQDPVALRPSETFAEQATLILASEAALLRSHQVPGELVLVGGSSVAGALTTGDVDLHLRVPPDAFAAAVTALSERSGLSELHRVVHPEIWQPTLATFDVAAPLPTGLAVTPVGSEHDLRFTRTWALLRERPDLVAAYNTAKLSGTIGDDGYEQRKSAFFDHVLTVWPPP